MDHLESSLINRFFEEYQDNTRMHMRVLLFRVFFVIPVYSFFKGRLRVGEMKKCLEWHFEYCARRVPTLRSERNTQNKSSSLTPFALFSMYRLPKHSAPNRRNICFRCFRILFGYVLLRFPSHFPLLYLAPFHRATSGRTPREEHDNSLPSKSADY